MRRRQQAAQCKPSLWRSRTPTLLTKAASSAATHLSGPEHGPNVGHNPVPDPESYPHTECHVRTVPAASEDALWPTKRGDAIPCLRSSNKDHVVHVQTGGHSAFRQPPRP